MTETIPAGNTRICAHPGCQLLATPDGYCLFHVGPPLARKEGERVETGPETGSEAGR